MIPGDVSGGSSLARNIVNVTFEEFKTEMVRKTIHLLVAVVPFMAAFHRPFTLIFLAAGTLAYAGMEALRFRGVNVPLVSSLTRMASRARDGGRFVAGPITLGLGAFLALFLFPPPVSAIAIYALAFGDGFASLVGKLFGSIRPRFLMGKSIEGSTACFIAVLLSAYLAVRDFPLALAAALTATVAEALPLDDYDNIALPLAVGFVVNLIR
jgi:dolichol kinase